MAKRKQKASDPKSPKLAYSVAETSRILDLGRMQTYQAVRNGQIPSIRIGRRILVPKAALERLLQGGQQQS
jgi:excisionase family DNA binding protein